MQYIESYDKIKRDRIEKNGAENMYIKENKEDISDIEDLEDCLQEIFDKYKMTKATDYKIGRSQYDFYYSIQAYNISLTLGKEKTYSHYIILGYDIKRMNPILKDLLKMKPMLQARLHSDLYIDYAPNNDYLYVAYKRDNVPGPFNKKDFLNNKSL